MITSLFVFFAVLIMTIFHSILSVINLALPSGIETSLTYVFGTLRYMIPIFPVADLMICIVFVLSAWSLIYGFKIVMWITSYIPWLGHRDLPGQNDSGDKEHATYDGTKSIRSKGNY